MSVLKLTDRELIFQDKSVSRAFKGTFRKHRSPSWLIKNKVENESGDCLNRQRSLSFYNVKPEDEYLHDPDRYQRAFVDYIERTSKQTLRFISRDGEFTLPYKHRWEKSYRRGILSKLYQLEIWGKRHGLSCGMLSLTSAQKGFTDIEILKRFKDSWSKFQDNLNKMGFQVFMLYEPHESGVPHMHAMIFGDCSNDVIDRLERLWHQKYGMGLEGIDFSFSPGLKDNPVLESVVNYLMKYLSKTVVSDIIDNRSLVRFHSLFYHTRSRMWSSSRYLSHVMGRTKIQYNKVSAPIDSIMIENTEIYNRAYSAAVAGKYGTWKIKDGGDGLKYKYELLPFEIKPKYERFYDAFIDNHAVRQWFLYWEDLIILMRDI